MIKKRQGVPKKLLQKPAAYPVYAVLVRHVEVADALRACGGMVDLNLVDEWAPMVFIPTSRDYRLVTMPMPASPRPQTEATKGEAQVAESVVDAKTEVEKAEAVAEAEELTKPKPKRKHRAKEPVAV